MLLRQPARRVGLTGFEFHACVRHSARRRVTRRKQFFFEKKNQYPDSAISRKVLRRGRIGILVCA